MNFSVFGVKFKCFGDFWRENSNITGNFSAKIQMIIFHFSGIIFHQIFDQFLALKFKVQLGENSQFFFSCLKKVVQKVEYYVV